MAIDQPLTRRQLLGATAATSAAVAAASLGLPAAAKALEAAALPGLSGIQRDDALALASTIAKQPGAVPSSRSPTGEEEALSPADLVEALSQSYARAEQVYRDHVDLLLEPLEVDGRRLASLSDGEREDFLRTELSLRRSPASRSVLVANAVDFLGLFLTPRERHHAFGSMASRIAPEFA